MFARRLTLQLKPNSVKEFKLALEKDVLPLLRKQNGFKDEMTFVVPNGNEALAISLWDRKETAEVYGREVYPELLKTLTKFVEGTPQLMTYEVAHSTFHKIAA